jgi:hypothetical protein
MTTMTITDEVQLQEAKSMIDHLNLRIPMKPDRDSDL